MEYLKLISHLHTSTLIRLIKKLKRLECLYVLIALTYGVIFIFLIPPGWNADEPQHYWRAQQIAHADFISDNFPGPGTITYTGGKLLPDELNFILSYRAFDAITDYSVRLNFPMWKNTGVIKHAAHNAPLVDTAFPGSAHYSPIVYLPQSLGLMFANVTGMPLLLGFFLAKFLALLVQVAAIAFAIYLIPRGKWILFTVGLLPSTVTQSVAFGGDVMTTAVSVLFIAAVLKVSYDVKKINYWHLSALAFLVLVLGLVKPAYLPLAGMVILIPILHKKFRSLANLLKGGALFALASLPGLIWLKLISHINDNYGRGVDVSAQSSYVIHHPLTFLSTLFTTYFTDAQPKLYKTLFGNFVWDTAPIPLIFMFLLVVVLVLSIFISSKREKKIEFTPIIKLIFVGITTLLTILISYGLYIYYTPYGDKSVLGIQGRYFIPFLPLSLLIFYNPTQYIKQRATKLAVLIILIGSLTESVAIIINRIYA